MNEVAEKVETKPEVTSAARAMSPFEEMDRMFDDWFPRGWMRPFRREWPALRDVSLPFEGRFPRVDLIDRDDEVVVRAELPGVKKKDLDVSVTDHTVTIKGSTKHEGKEEKGDYYRCEMSHGAFARTLALPGEVDGEKSKSTFKDGVLELTFPKIEKAKRRSIKVE